MLHCSQRDIVDNITQVSDNTDRTIPLDDIQGSRPPCALICIIVSTFR